LFEMHVRILPFGVLKESLGADPFAFDLPHGSTVADLLGRLGVHAPVLELLGIAVSVNAEYAERTRVLLDDDEVGLLPPVSGGKSSAEGLKSAHCAIVREPIDIQAIRKNLERSEDGSALFFDGIVRNNTRGRRTLYLDYEAYEAMALNEMEKLAQAALEQFKVRDVCLVHRLGRLEIGETSVLIGVASAHRVAAFEACRWLIDTLKKTVPIWKKEYFEDGAVWADGEPFPEEIRINT